MSAIDEAMRLYRERHPDAFARADVIARIIDPAAYSAWTASDGRTQELMNLRQDYMRSVALNKACEILRVLGVNMDCDWMDVLTKLCKEKWPT